jgi:Mg-chelatase subunit ChlD
MDAARGGAEASMQIRPRSWIATTISAALLVSGAGFATAAGDALAEPIAARRAPAADTQPRALDLVLALDNSGSMRRNDTERLVHRVIAELGRRLAPSARVGLVRFDTDADVILPLQEGKDGNLETALAAAAGQLRYDGRLTNIPAGVESAIYELREHGRRDADRVILLLTDGIIDLGSVARNLSQTLWLRDTLAAAANDQGIRVFGMAFTDDADLDLLQGLSQRTGGRYFRVFSAAGIAPALDSLQMRLAEIAHANAERAATNAFVIEQLDKTARAAAAAEAAAEQAARAAGTTAPVHVFLPEPTVHWNMMLLAFTGLVGLGTLTFSVWQRRRRRAVDPSPMPAARLKVLGQPGRNVPCYALVKSITRIGRARDNDIVLQQKTVSAHHAVIEWCGGVFLLRDVGSTNGTRKNGTLISDPARIDMRTVPLKHGDRITLDACRFQFLVGAAERGDNTQVDGIALPDVTVVRDAVAVGRGGGHVTVASSEQDIDRPVARPARPVRSPAEPEDCTQLKPRARHIHGPWDAIATCRHCGQTICEWCGTERDGEPVCIDCAALEAA